MHIEPGLLSQAKILAAGVAASGLYAAYAPQLLKAPAQWLRTLLAAAAFTLLMQSWSLPVGPSELHLVGAMPIYLAFGFLPTLFGFGLGLLAQGLLFEPQDLAHLAVNALTLAVPLVALHATLGQRIQRLSVANVLKLDAAYYAGVTAMVGFWLLNGMVATPVAEWAQFAGAYLAVAAVEPFVTLAVLALVTRARRTRVGALCFAARG
ncbi:energy-coupling factor ABC transporter permease [Caldimonas tepidiphila]|uniref:energy-coupling factor ABC transporter permease n=1 Tax=Caldimonas tepidiphila TaxID=2315841 RepID=UPI000E5AE995|nr:energy-coupling factor ABC transporter permease [Caldimonas tepidiphila]